MRRRILLFLLAMLIAMGILPGGFSCFGIAPIRTYAERAGGEEPADEGNVPNAAQTPSPELAPEATQAPRPTPAPPVLKRGSKGDEVRLLQTRLREYGFLSDKPDGVFGPKTEQAVKDVQRYLREIDENHEAEVNEKGRFNDLVTLEQSADDHKRDAAVTMEILPEENDGDPSIDSDPFEAESGAADEPNVNTGNEADADGEGDSANDDLSVFPDAGDSPQADPREPNSSEEHSEALSRDDENLDYPILYDGADDESAPPDVGEDDARDDYEPDGVVDADLRSLLLEDGFCVYQIDLRYGSYGTEVRRLQKRLNTLGYLDGGIDGVFSHNTKNALIYFQERNRLPTTGVADRDTQYTLYSPEAKITDKPVYQYYLKISINDQKVFAYGWEDGEYSDLERTMVCSTGLDGTPTPKGVFASGGPVAKWCYFPRYACWAQYAFRIEGSILFHSVLFTEARESALRQGSVTSLGRKASHGCVRLSVEDAKWIYDNCKAGTTVEVY